MVAILEEGGSQEQEPKYPVSFLSPSSLLHCLNPIQVRQQGSLGNTLLYVQPPGHICSAQKRFEVNSDLTWR